MSIAHWIAAARLRTLPLAFSCILFGTLLAVYYGHFSAPILGWSLLTTLFYQVLSNYANDYGDGVKGTDAERQGEARAVSSGAISAGAMKNAVILVGFMAWFSGAWLSYLGTRGLDPWVFIAFLILNTGAVSSAIRYTVGHTAYGYKGLGDVYVLIFFGLIGVKGSFFLQAREWDWWILLPAAAVGFLAMGVLNLNNMRDLESDRKSGKNTVPVRIGLKRARIYHLVLLLGSMLFTSVFVQFRTLGQWSWLFAVVIPLLAVQLSRALRAKEAGEFDKLLKPLALITLLFTIIAGIGLNMRTILLLAM